MRLLSRPLCARTPEQGPHTGPGTESSRQVASRMCASADTKRRRGSPPVQSTGHADFHSRLRDGIHRQTHERDLPQRCSRRHAPSGTDIYQAFTILPKARDSFTKTTTNRPLPVFRRSCGTDAGTITSEPARASSSRSPTDSTACLCWKEKTSSSLLSLCLGVPWPAS